MIAQYIAFELELQRLTHIFSLLRMANLEFNPKKCEFFRRKVKLLGHVVNEEGAATDPDKVEVVTNWPLPKKLMSKMLEAFLGYALTTGDLYLHLLTSPTLCIN